MHRYKKHVDFKRTSKNHSSNMSSIVHPLPWSELVDNDADDVQEANIEVYVPSIEVTSNLDAVLSSLRTRVMSRMRRAVVQKAHSVGEHECAQLLELKKGERSASQTRRLNEAVQRLSSWKVASGQGVAMFENEETGVVLVRVENPQYSVHTE